MMALIQIIDDDGKVLVEQRTAATTPLTYRLPVPLTVPCMVGGKVAGEYKIWGMTYQPMVKLSGKIGGT